MEIRYYTNAKGMVAFSTDQGLTVCVPTGRTITPPPAWEEVGVGGNLRKRLTKEQNIILKQAIEKDKALSPIQRLARDLELNEAREKVHYAPPEEPVKEVPLSAQVITSDLKD